MKRSPGTEDLRKGDGIHKHRRPNKVTGSGPAPKPTLKPEDVTTVGQLQSLLDFSGTDELICGKRMLFWSHFIPVESRADAIKALNASRTF
jgi:hypothetical protein